MPSKLLLNLLLFSLMATGLFAQEYPGRRPVTCRQESISLQDLFKVIYEQTGMTAFYNDEQISSYEKVSPDFYREPLDNVLAWLLRKRGMVWCYRKEVFVVAFKRPGDEDLGLLPEEKHRTITGIVVNEKRLPLEGVAVIAEGNVKGAQTNKGGQFILEGVERGTGLSVRRAGYKPMELYFYADSVYVQLIPMIAPLQEIKVNAAPQRTLTGSVSKIGEDQVASQPVNNVLGALQGRIPGLYINQVTGLPGGGYKVRLRGKNSIESVSDPLILLDGMPFPSVSFNESYINNVGNGVPLSANVAASPLNLLTVNDIESIEILKDAEATAVYGTRGANGVILINSKQPGGEKGFTANYYTGIGEAVNLVRYMNTQEYLAMRHEAILKDGRTVDSTLDYDIAQWDTTRYTDWQKEMIGKTARISEGSLELKGGWQHFDYRVSGVFRQESTVYPSETFKYKKGAGTLQLRYTSANDRLRVDLAGNYVADRNFLPTTDLTTYSTLPPNTPRAHSKDNKLNFDAWNAFENPYAILLRTSDANSRNRRAILNTIFTPLDGLTFRANMGMSGIEVEEFRVNPMQSFDPAITDRSGDSYFFTNKYRNGLIDLQGNWQGKLGNGKFDLLMGTRLQFDDQFLESYAAYGYTNDGRLKDTAAAEIVLPFPTIDTNYRYRSYYGRLEYILAGKYILGLTINRDHSSRLSEGNRNHTFWSAGAGWTFSSEKWLKNNPVLSLGKLRGSYGITGNDQYARNMSRETTIPDTVLPGRGALARNPDFTPVHTWEKIRRAEIALDLGFMQDRISATFCYYNNKSTNQLLTGAFTLPSGEMQFIPVNYDAVVKNTGFEIDLEASPVKSSQVNWITNLNLSFPKNELAVFPNLAKTSYQSYYNEGMSLDMVQSLRFKELDAETGAYRFDDLGNNGSLADDKRVGKEQGPFWYGGWYNSIRYKNIEMSCLLRFAKQNNYNYLYMGSPYAPGNITNQPLLVQDHWKSPGDRNPVQRYTASASNAVALAYRLMQESDQQLTDASFLRLQSIVIAYHLPQKMLDRIKIKSCKLYMQGLNLFTITGYKGRDPEITASPNSYPSLRMITAGIKFTY